MSDINHVTMSGRLGRDPETRAAGSTTVTSFSMASTQTSGKGDARKEITTWVQVEVWGNYGEMLAKHMAKGDFAVVSGRLKVEEYEKDGAKRTSVKISADNVGGTFWKKGGSSKAVDDDFGPDDIPF